MHHRIQLGVRFATVLSSDLATHPPTDHWVQTDRQARGKQQDWRYCARHVLAHTAVTTAAAALALRATGQPARPIALGARALVNGVTHYIADRRRPVLALAEALRKKEWVDNDPAAAYQLDQAWHIGFLYVAALLDTAVAARSTA